MQFNKVLRLTYQKPFMVLAIYTVLNIIFIVVIRIYAKITLFFNYLSVANYCKTCICK